VGLAIKMVLLLASAAVGALIVFFIIFFSRPLATIVWLRRNALRRAGLRKTRLTTTVGGQTVWHGGSGPLLVLLHGAGDQAGTWNKVAAELKRHFQLLIPDLAGHGGSDPVKGVLSLGTLLTALEQVLDARPWRGAPMVVAGNSLGAWMAMLYAEKNPHRVTRVILIDGCPIKDALLEVNIMPKDREEARRAFDAVLDPSTPGPANFVLDDVVRVSNTGPISRLLAAGVDDISKYLFDGRLASFPLPVDLVWGASDRLVPLGHAKKFQSELPHCALTVIERCGHAPQFERPRELICVLLQILAPESSGDTAAAPSVHKQPEENS